MKKFLLDVSPLRRHRDFRLLYFGQTISYLGSMLTHVAVPYQIYELTHSLFWVGMMGTVQLVPLLLAGLYGGAIADRMDRKKLLVWSEGFLLLLSIVLAINAMSAQPSVVLIFVVVALMQVLNGIHRPSMDAITPRLIESHEISSVAALGSLRYSVCAIIGPAVGGLLIASFGPAITYAIDAASFGAAMISLKLIRAPREQLSASQDSTTEQQSSALSSIAEGIRYAVKRPELIGTYVVDIVAMLFAMPMALYPAMAKQFSENGSSPNAIGWLYASMAIGSLVVSLFSGWSSRIQRHGAAVILAAAAWGIAIIALGWAQSLWATVACLAIAGGADMISGIFRGTIWNQTIPNAFRGRLAGVEMISYMSGPMLGNARAGWVADLRGISFSVISGGVLCVIGVLACIWILPEFWKYLAPTSE